MTLDETVSEFIGSIYEGAYNDSAWDDVIRNLLVLTHARVCLVSKVDAQNQHYESARFYGREDSKLAEAGTEYEEEIYRTDLTLQYAAENPDARFCDSRWVFPKTNYTDHPMIKWNRSRLGSTHWLVGYTRSDDGLTFGVSIHPPASIGPIAREDGRLFRMLFDHMDHALRLAARPPVIETSNEALIFIGRDGTVQQISPLAEKIIDRCDGLKIVAGSLEAATTSDTIRLNKAIRSALTALADGGAGGATRLPRPSGKRDWLVTARPLPGPAFPCSAFRPAAIVRIMDPAQHGRMSGLQSKLFKLTVREAEVAELLLAGHSLESLAAALEMSRNTARVHVHSLLRKTATNRQSDLIRLLLATADRTSQ